jgi:hypothetical protein
MGKVFLYITVHDFTKKHTHKSDKFSQKIWVYCMMIVGPFSVHIQYSNSDFDYCHS